MLERMYSTIGALFRVHGAGGGGAFGGGVGQLESLLDLEVRQAFDFEDAAGEDVLLPFFSTVSRPCLMAYSGMALTRSRRVMPGCIWPFEAHQHRFRHVQRHHAGGGGEGDQAGTGREGDADREAGVSRRRCRRCPAAAGGSARVDDAVARTQGNAAAGADEVRQFVVHLDVDRLRISGGVTEGLHDQVGEKPRQARSFSSSRVIGPVVSCEPTVVIFGSQ